MTKTLRPALPYLFVLGLSVLGSPVQAQPAGCAVWSHAENRCIQDAPAQAQTAACVVWSQAEHRCLDVDDSPAGRLARTIEAGHAARDASLERVRQLQALATPIAPQLQAITGVPPVPTVRAKCATEWPEDFKMRAYCETQQAAAIGKIAARHETVIMKTPTGGTIRAKCAKDWPGDFKMTNYCEEQQLKALSSLR